MSSVNFAAAAGFAPVNEGSGVATANTGKSKTCTVTVLVNRTYAYNHSAAFKSFLETKYTSGGTFHSDAMHAVLNGDTEYKKK